MKNTDKAYQFGFSEKDRKVLDSISRLKKAKTIFLVLKEELGKLDNKCCLDIGCSGGIISNYLSDACRHVVGIDIDAKAMILAKEENKNKDNTAFILGDAISLPLKNECFDIVICKHVFEPMASLWGWKS